MYTFNVFLKHFRSNTTISNRLHQWWVWDLWSWIHCSNCNCRIQSNILSNLLLMFLTIFGPQYSSRHYYLVHKMKKPDDQISLKSWVLYSYLLLQNKYMLPQISGSKKKIWTQLKPTPKPYKYIICFNQLFHNQVNPHIYWYFLRYNTTFCKTVSS